MREPERDPGRLQDIITAANHIASFTEGYSQKELAVDKLRYFAVVGGGLVGYCHRLRTKPGIVRHAWFR